MPIGHGAFSSEGQARTGKSVLALRAEGGEDFRAQALGDSADPLPSRKASLQGCWRPYRKPTQVGRGKCPKVNEITLVKELDKLAL